MHERPSPLRHWLLPQGATPVASAILLARSLRALVDGYMAVLLPAYLLALGLGPLQVGILATTTLLGSAAATLAVGTWAHRLRGLPLLQWAALLMAATGLGFATLSAYWPLLLVAFIGTLNPSSGDVSVFLPLEHARLAGAATGEARTTLFARYSVLGALCAAIGALAAALPGWLTAHTGIAPLAALRGMFLLYALVGILVWWLYRRAPQVSVKEAAQAAPLGPSRAIVLRLAALFSLDSFAGGMVINTLLALWLQQRFGLSLAQAGVFFFWTGLLSAGSQLVAPRLARHIGLVNTMVFTHIPANLCLILAAFAPTLPVAMALLLVRGALSQMDVPARSAFVMAAVTPAERAAAASMTAVPRSLAAAISPSLAGALYAAGWLAAPMLAGGLLKIVYDLTLWRAFSQIALPEE